MYVLFLSAQTENLSNNIPKEQKPLRWPINSNVRDALAFDIMNKQKALMFVFCYACSFGPEKSLFLFWATFLAMKHKKKTKYSVFFSLETIQNVGQI